MKNPIERHGLHAVPVNPKDLEALIHSGGNVTREDLKKALKNKEISPEKYIELLEALQDRTEINLKETQAKLTASEQRTREIGEELERAGIDGLTSVWRRERLNPILNKLLEDLERDPAGEHRHSVPSAVMVIRLDINQFKVFNELPYSHTFGDTVLRSFAERITKSMKDSDKIFRVGGDEFVIVMPIFNDDVNFESLFEVKEALINENLSIEAPNGDVLDVTASMGYSVVEKGKEHKTAEQLLIEADEMERKTKGPR